jgi:hypothetical protein
LKENNLNFGETIYLKSRAERHTTQIYGQVLKTREAGRDKQELILKKLR